MNLPKYRRCCYVQACLSTTSLLVTYPEEGNKDMFKCNNDDITVCITKPRTGHY
jgi:hypothetical protein